MSHPPSSREPSWRPLPLQRRGGVPGALWPWLADRGSLTRRVTAHCDGCFRVRLLRQLTGRPLLGETQRLGVRRGTLAVIREVELHCAGRPWVFARSLIPLTSLVGPARRLTHLGERPLGALLFAARDVVRGETEVARLLPGDALYAAATAGLALGPVELWGRRTRFEVAGRPLLVNEIFLPELPPWEGRHG